MAKRTTFLALFACLSGGCVKTELTTIRDDPASAQAPTTPLPRTGAALTPEFDPLAPEDGTSGSAEPGAAGRGAP